MSLLIESSAIYLDADLDLTAAAALKKQLLGAVEQGALVHVDASSVERITTPCAQVLVAAARSLSNQGGGLVVKSPSEPFVSAFSELGLNEVMQQRVMTK